MSQAASNYYVLGHSSEELERLIAQNHYFGELTEQVLCAAGIGAGLRVLDIGCGPGDVSFLLAKLVGPHGEVIGIDRSTDAINLAQRRAQTAGLRNVNFMTREIEQFAADDKFDAIVGRLVLMYLSDPAAELRRLARQLNPEGVLAFHEIHVCGAHTEPHLALLQLSIDRVAETFRRVGASPSTGLRLPQIFRAAGLPAPKMLAHTRVAACGDTRLFEQLAAITRSLLPAMERFGIATANEVDVDTLAVRLSRDAAEQDATVLGPLFIGAWTRL
jgi:2-polyprenyl-3-methyl-5-hydroxy-6-metoxy-1,4-benzoquinol methylase